MNDLPSGRWRDSPLIFDGTNYARERSPGRVQIVTLMICVWAGSFVLATVRDLADPPPDFAVVTVIRLVAAIAGMALCWPIKILLDSLRARPLGIQFVVALLASSVVATVYYPTSMFVVAMAGRKIDTSPSWVFYNIVYWAMFFLAWCALYLALQFHAIAMGRIEQAAEMERYAHAASTRALRYQLDPHFLFNTLNAVSALVVTRQNDAADAMLDRLSRFFRATLAIDPVAPHSLADEIELQRIYLAIEQVRFPDLTVDIEVTAEAGRFLVPALLLQPLIENAVKFGISGKTGPARIGVRAWMSEGTLTIVIEDDGAGTAAGPGTGTGLLNVRSRLSAQFGSAAELRTGRRDQGGFAVQITIADPS